MRSRLLLIVIMMISFIGSPAYAVSLSEIQSLIDKGNAEIDSYDIFKEKAFSYNDYQRRDPMNCLLNKEGRLVTSGTHFTELHLTGIVWNKTSSFAFINDIVCQEGDLIGAK